MNPKLEIRNYWNSRKSTYDRSPGHVCLPEVWSSVLRETFNSNMRILDVGTGTGFLALILAELGHEVVGLDISDGMIELAKKKAEKKGLKIQFKLGDAENLPFKDNSFDAVICRHLLWTLPSPKKALAEWVRVARYKVVVIDGKWLDNSLSTKIRKFLGRILIGIYERRNPFKHIHYRKEINRTLPFYGGVDREEIVKMFESFGLKPKVKDLTWIREIMMRDLPFVYKISWTKNEYYMIEGFKR